MSGFYHTFITAIVDISDSTRPRVVSQCPAPGDRCGVWAEWTANRAYVAGRNSGLAILDISDINNPTVDTSIVRASSAVDIHVFDNRAYVADNVAGMSILDVSNPGRPFELGKRDSTGATCVTVVGSDSFAFLSWRYGHDQFRSVLVSDPSRPLDVASLTVPSRPEDMVLRDTLVYAAGNQRFYVVNVARPREPRLVGSLAFSGTGRHVDLWDTVAYVATGSGGLMCVNVADPTDPRHVGSWFGRTSATVTRDTLLYLAAPYTGCVSLNVTNPASPRVVDSLHLTDTLWWNDLALVDSIAYIGGERAWAVDISDPADLRLVPGVSWTPPYLIQRIEYVAPYFYLACYDAGVCILEPTQTGIAEERPGGRVQTAVVLPNPTRGEVRLRAAGAVRGWRVIDVTGKVVAEGSATGADIDLSWLAPGVYIMRVQGSGVGGQVSSQKVVITR